MRGSRRGRLRMTACAVVALVVTAAPALAAVAPDYELPFSCGQQWSGSTRPWHSPSSRAIDFNRAGDVGDLVLASAPGVVSRVENLGNRSYGRWVRVDHGGGHSSLYAHLRAAWVRVGQRVDQGAALGLLGASGAATGPHLHFEERLGDRVRRASFHQRAYSYGRGASRNCSDVPVAGDWDGSGGDELGVFRRTARAQFRLRLPDGTTTRIVLGQATDVPVVGDWDGDGRTDIGVWRPAGHTFLLRADSGSVARVPLGRPGDVPVAGDWDGDQLTDVGVWRPGTHSFHLLRRDGSTAVVPFGFVGSQPVAGDWDGDGLAEVGVFNAGVGTFLLRAVAADGVAPGKVSFGDAGRLPVIGDWDADGVDDLGTWSRGTATFSLRTPAGVTTSRFGAPRR